MEGGNQLALKIVAEDLNLIETTEKQIQHVARVVLKPGTAGL